MRQPIAVVGGGGFGTGLALAMARAHDRRILLWSRRQRELEPENITCVTEHAALSEAELIFVAVPSPHVEPLARAMGEHLDGRHLLVHVSRGLIGDELSTVGEVLRTKTPCRRVGALAGPLVGQALASGEPGGGIVGSLFPEVAGAVREALGGSRLRIYSTDDIIGVEMASALVGLLALIVGYAQGVGMGTGTLAVLASRGIVEAARVGVLRGAQRDTFAGLAGFGDLLAAVAGDDRPEVAFGRSLAEGQALAEAAEEAGAYVEGASIARRIAAYADRHSVEAPLASTTAAVLEGALTGREALEQLMARPVGRE